MKNKVLNGLAFNDEVRFFIADTKELVNKLQQTNQSLAVASAALGRSASITGIMGLMLKDNQEVTSILKGDGPLGQLISIANDQGHVRAMVTNPQVEIPLKENGKLDVRSAVGENGSLKIIKNLNMREPFTGEVDLLGGEVAEDFTYYFTVSEQTPTAITAGVLVDVDYSIKSSGVLLVQLLPNASSETIDKLETNIYALKSISNLLLEKSLEDILKDMFGEDFRVLEEQNLEFRCTCSQERFLNSIRVLKHDEIKEIKEDETIEVECHFCRQKYNIDTKLI